MATITSALSVVNPDTTYQVVGGWLTDQTRRVIWYEQLINRAEFEYIVSPGNRLYTGAGQRKAATNSDGNYPSGLSLPIGKPPARTPQPWNERGATEIKAAWRILTDLPALWNRYHLADALLYDNDTGKCTRATIGLVGLHIIRKTESFPNFLWATFEHIDNVPYPSDQDVYQHPFGFTFNNPNCSGPACAPNEPREKCDDTGKKCKPVYPVNQPVQTTRIAPISLRDRVVQLNLAMQQMISKSTKGKSVFQYYQLVNVQWPQSPNPPYTKPKGEVPLSTASMTSAGPNSPVANTTMETYVQRKNCTDCHRFATIAGSDKLASDFSFVFGKAK